MSAARPRQPRPGRPRAADPPALLPHQAAERGAGRQPPARHHQPRGQRGGRGHTGWVPLCRHGHGRQSSYIGTNIPETCDGRVLLTRRARHMRTFPGERVHLLA